MRWLVDVDWSQTFVPDTPLVEIFVRGSLTYLALFLLLRLVLKRESGAMSVTDILVVVLIADAAQNAMADDYRSITDGVLLVAVIVGWDWVLNWLGFRFRGLERLIKPPKLALVEHGELRLDNMRRELVPREELASQLREQGIDDVRRVRVAYMEPDGQISVLTHDDEPHPRQPQSQAVR